MAVTIQGLSTHVSTVPWIPPTFLRAAVTENYAEKDICWVQRPSLRLGPTFVKRDPVTEAVGHVKDQGLNK